MEAKGSDQTQVPSSHLFMLRMWLEDVGEGQTDWRCSVKCVNSGEVRYFRDWQTLEVFVDEQLHRNSMVPE